MGFLANLALGFGVSFACLVLSCRFVGKDGWGRLMSLLVPMIAAFPIAYLTLPGGFTRHEDYANGLLVLMMAYRIFWLWGAAAIGALFFYGPAKKLGERMWPDSPAGDLFE